MLAQTEGDEGKVVGVLSLSDVGQIEDPARAGAVGLDLTGSCRTPLRLR